MINRRRLHIYIDDLATHLHYLVDCPEMEPDLQEKWEKFSGEEKPERKVFWAMILDFILHCWASETLPKYFLSNIRQTANWQQKVLQALLKRLA